MESQEKQKRNLAPLIFGVVAVCLIVGLFVFRVPKMKIRSLVYDLTEQPYEVFRDEKRVQDAKDFVKYEYYEETILNYLTAYRNMEPTEDGYRQEALKKAVKLVYYLNRLEYSDPDVDNAFQQFVLDEMQVYMDARDFDTVVRTISLLDENEIQNEVIKNAFQIHLNNTRAAALSSSGWIALSDYMWRVNSFLDGSYYTSILECYPYDDMINYIQENGQLVITESGLGGYYDNMADKYDNESYWYDPLSKRKVEEGSIGTYQYKEEHILCGDFRVEITSQYWYMTNKSDDINYLHASLYYKEKEEARDYQEITAFLRKITGDNCYCVDLGDDDYMFFVLEKDQITIMDYHMFAIAYE